MKDLLLHNWRLKLISLALATALWAQVARTPASETGLYVPLVYQNIPPQTEVFDDVTTRVEVRLRGASALLRTLGPQDVSLAIDMRTLEVGSEKVLPLTPDLVHAPFGVEVVRVVPARVHLTIDKTQGKAIQIVPKVKGLPGSGFEIEKTTVSPALVDIEGPASRVGQVDVIPTTVVDVTGKRESFSQAVDLDIPDPVVRVPKTTPVKVEVLIRRSKP